MNLINPRLNMHLLQGLPVPPGQRHVIHLQIPAMHRAAPHGRLRRIGTRHIAGNAVCPGSAGSAGSAGVWGWI